MKMFLSLILALTLFAQEPQKIVREGNTFTKVVEPVKEEVTPFTYKIVKDGTEQLFPVYITKNNACYIKRISQKTGKEYRQYLPKEISAEIAKEYRK